MSSVLERKKTVVFRVRTNSNIFFAAIIGELYFKDHRRILLTSWPVDGKYESRILNSGLFDQVVRLREVDRSIFKIEQCVDEFLEKNPCIDTYFLQLAEDPHGYLLACRLQDKAKICLYPDGSACINFRKKIERDLGKSAFRWTTELREFYRKYPIDLGIIDETWLPNQDIPREGIPAAVRIIEFGKIFQGNQYVVEKLNVMFNFHGSSALTADAFYFDDALAMFNWMEVTARRRILEELFRNLPGKKVMVKAHPGVDTAFEIFSFSGIEVEIYDQSDMPWELMYLNILLQEERKTVVLITLVPGTSILSSVNIAREHDCIKVLLLENIARPFLAKHIVSGIDMDMAYYEKVQREKENFLVFRPATFAQLREACQEIFPGGCDARKYQEKDLHDIDVAHYEKVGNLLSKSYLLDHRSAKQFCTYFDFLGETSELSFPLDEIVDFSELLWWPSENHVFKSVSTLEVLVEGKNKELQEIYSLDGGAESEYLLNYDGSFRLPCAYQGYCKRLHIRAQLHTRDSYCQLAKNYESVKWRAEFWENWVDIQQTGRIGQFVKQKQLREVWIFGKGKIGKLIQTALDEFQVKIRYIATKGKETPDGRVYGIEEITAEMGVPDMVVVTPMYDYRNIFYSLPNYLRERTRGIDAFTREVLQ